MLDEVLDPFSGCDEVMKILHEEGSCAFGNPHSGNLQTRLVNEVGDYPADLELIGCEPGLNDQETPRVQMIGHVVHGLAKASFRFDMSDGAEETRDDIEASSQIESGHVSEVKTHVRMLLPSLPQHPGVVV